MKLKRDKITKIKKLPSMPKNYLNYINSVKRKAKKYGIEVFFSNEDVVYDSEDDNLGCGGFFSEESKRLATATNNNITHWFSIFIHESCHMDQWIERREWWDKNLEIYSRFFEWLAFEKEYTAKELEESRQIIIEIEQDCEKRAIEKIKKYKFKNIKIKRYIQEANSYLFLYTFMRQKRKWYNNIHSKPNCWSLCPARFPKDYKKIPKKLLNAFIEAAGQIDKKAA